jgi:Tfp pilus assembly protein PilF
MLRSRSLCATSESSVLALILVALFTASCGRTPTSGERAHEAALATTLARHLAPHMAGHDTRAVAAAIESALARPDVAWVFVQDGDGQSVASVQRGEVDRESARTDIVRGAWCPGEATWIECREASPSIIDNLTLPIESPEGIEAGRVGTLSVGFRRTGFAAPLHRLMDRGRRTLGSWMPPSDSRVTTPSREARAYYEEGVRAMRKFYESEARTAWLMALEEDPNFAMAMVRLGRLAHDLADDEAAFTWYRRALAGESRVSERERLEIRLLGAELEGREDDERALENELIRRFDDDADVLMVAANQHLTEGRPEEALANLQAAASLDPSRTDVWNLLGYAHTELGQWPEAEENFEKSAFVHDGQANPHDSLGEFYLRTGNYRKALAQFERSTEIKPDFSWAHYHLALVNAELGRWEAAFFAIERARDVSRQSPEARHWSRTQISLHLRAGRVAEAAALAAVHRSTFAVKAGDLALLTRVALASGDEAAARAGLEETLVALQEKARARGDELTDLDSFYLIPEIQGLLLKAEGATREAIEQLDRAHAAAHGWEARQRIEREVIGLLIQSGRHEEGTRRLEAILARNPNDPVANWFFARILEAEGHPGEARASLERARRALEGADEDDPLTAAVREAWRSAGG